MDVVEIPDKAQQSVLPIEPHTHLQLTLDMCSQQIGTLIRYMLVKGMGPVEYPYQNRQSVICISRSRIYLQRVPFRQPDVPERVQLGMLG